MGSVEGCLGPVDPADLDPHPPPHGNRLGPVRAEIHARFHPAPSDANRKGHRKVAEVGDRRVGHDIDCLPCPGNRDSFEHSGLKTFQGYFRLRRRRWSLILLKGLPDGSGREISHEAVRASAPPRPPNITVGRDLRSGSDAINVKTQPDHGRAPLLKCPAGSLQCGLTGSQSYSIPNAVACRVSAGLGMARVERTGNRTTMRGQIIKKPSAAGPALRHRW